MKSMECWSVKFEAKTLLMCAPCFLVSCFATSTFFMMFFPAFHLLGVAWFSLLVGAIACFPILHAREELDTTVLYAPKMIMVRHPNGNLCVSGMKDVETMAFYPDEDLVEVALIECNYGPIGRGGEE